MTITSTYVDSRVDSNTGNPCMTESILTLCKSRLYPPVRDFRIWPLYCVFSESDVRVSYLNKALCDDAH